MSINSSLVPSLSHSNLQSSSHLHCKINSSYTTRQPHGSTSLHSPVDFDFPWHPSLYPNMHFSKTFAVSPVLAATASAPICNCRTVVLSSPLERTASPVCICACKIPGLCGGGLWCFETTKKCLNILTCHRDNNLKHCGGRPLPIPSLPPSQTAKDERNWFGILYTTGTVHATRGHIELIWYVLLRPQCRTTF